jgi:hypothetical protein
MYKVKKGEESEEGEVSSTHMSYCYLQLVAATSSFPPD